MRLFFSGFKGMLPITPGIIPFGAIMGTVCAEANLSLFENVSMNFLVFAGAAQLAAIDLMLKEASHVVIIVTALVINLRFILYSAALSPLIQNSPFLVKALGSYLITDQNYAVMSAHLSQFKSNKEAIIFYFGASLCMVMTWHTSVIAGYIFGNFAPSSWALDFAIPLSFAALTMPTIKNKNYITVALFSFIGALLLADLPYNLGLIVTANLAIVLGLYLSKRGQKA